MSTDRNIELFRSKCTMVMYAFERALGSYVLNSGYSENISKGLLETICNRKGLDLNSTNIEAIIQETFLSEILDMALHVSKPTSDHQKLQELFDFSKSLELFDIRNSISHPNRPFPEGYWYRMASLASHPAISTLGMQSVIEALYKAEEGTLTDPPELWKMIETWSIANNLPADCDHDITGLIARNSEMTEIKKALANKRLNLLSIVAPGGVGKTSLVLECLNVISADTKWGSLFDAIIWVSLKTQSLTADGIETSEKIISIKDVEESIRICVEDLYPSERFGNFEEVKTRLESEKLLICVDNLETLLVKEQSEFLAFNQELPQAWKVVVTSRISVDSATTITIKNLKDNGALSLARAYFKKRGVNSPDMKLMNVIVEKSERNALAIRLIIDLFNRGQDITTAFKRASKNIAEYSYNNLIQNLSSNSIKILEGIFILESLSKSQMVSHLEMNSDEVAESLYELTRTSLIHRADSETGNETFTLSTSIRDFLLVHPTNVKFRREVSKLVNREKTRNTNNFKDFALGFSISEFDWTYIDDDLNETEQKIILRLNNLLKNKKKNSVPTRLRDDFREALMLNDNSAELLFHHARFLDYLGDTVGARENNRLALKMKPDYARYIHFDAANSLKRADYSNARNQIDKILEMGFGKSENSSLETAESVIKISFQINLDQENYNEILEDSINWEDLEEHNVLIGNYRASAHCRLLLNSSSDDKPGILESIIGIYSKILIKSSYSYMVCREALKFMQLPSWKLEQQFSSPHQLLFLNFVHQYFPNVIDSIKGETLYSPSNYDLIQGFVDMHLENNPFINCDWFEDREYYYDESVHDSWIKHGYVPVKVYTVQIKSSTNSRTLWAKDADGDEYCLFRDKFQGDEDTWLNYGKSDWLAIKYIINPKFDSGTATEILPFNHQMNEGLL